MKLISLNAWGGRALEAFLEFIKENRDTDVFCFQEILHGNIDEKIWYGAKSNLFSMIKALLPEHVGFFASCEDRMDDRVAPRGLEIPFGLAMFVKKTIDMREEGDLFVHGNRNALSNYDSATQGRNIQYLKMAHNGKEFMVVNFHGLWNGKGKTDTPERLKQSQNIKKFVDDYPGDVILMGDFNLLPDAESLVMFEDRFTNLIKKYDIKSTRTDLYPKEIKYADYIFISKGIKPLSLDVPNLPVSDHRPLILEIS